MPKCAQCEKVKASVKFSGTICRACRHELRVNQREAARILKRIEVEKNMLKLAPDNRQTTQQPTDVEGTVVVKIYLCEKGHTPVKGNLSRTIRVVGKVSEVYQAILAISEKQHD